MPKMHPMSLVPDQGQSTTTASNLSVPTTFRFIYEVPNKAGMTSRVSPSRTGAMKSVPIEVRLNEVPEESLFHTFASFSDGADEVDITVPFTKKQLTSYRSIRESLSQSNNARDLVSALGVSQYLGDTPTMKKSMQSLSLIAQYSKDGASNFTNYLDGEHNKAGELLKYIDIPLKQAAVIAALQGDLDQAHVLHSLASEDRFSLSTVYQESESGLCSAIENDETAVAQFLVNTMALPNAQKQYFDGLLKALDKGQVDILTLLLPKVPLHFEKASWSNEGPKPFDMKANLVKRVIENGNADMLRCLNQHFQVNNPRFNMQAATSDITYEQYQSAVDGQFDEVFEDGLAYSESPLSFAVDIRRSEIAQLLRSDEFTFTANPEEYSEFAPRWTPFGPDTHEYGAGPARPSLDLQISTLSSQRASGMSEAERFLSTASLLDIVQNYDLDALKRFIEVRELTPDLLADTTENGMTALHLATEASDEAAMKILLQHGADVTSKDASGWTPLHCAVDQANPRSVARLLAEDAPTDVKNAKNKIPIRLLPKKPTRSCPAEAHQLIKDLFSGTIVPDDILEDYFPGR